MRCSKSSKCYEHLLVVEGARARVFTHTALDFAFNIQFGRKHTRSTVVYAHSTKYHVYILLSEQQRWCMNTARMSIVLRTTTTTNKKKNKRKK